MELKSGDLLFYEKLLWGVKKSEFIRERIDCEIFLSEHFMKYSFRGTSWNMKYFHGILLA